VLSLACSFARDAINQASIDAVLIDAAKIRFINMERLKVGIADGWTDQMLQVVDAANGFASLRNEPDLSDGGIGLRASMHNLVELCLRERL
jgi:hypothetical protein